MNYWIAMGLVLLGGLLLGFLAGRIERSRREDDDDRAGDGPWLG